MSVQMNWTAERAIIASNGMWKLNNFTPILWRVLKPIGKYTSKENKIAFQ